MLLESDIRERIRSSSEMRQNQDVKQSSQLLDKETSFIFPCWRVKRSTKLMVATIILGLTIFVERYCFIVVVYKAKYYGYVLILMVIFLNVIFNYFNAKLRE
jgi:ABC-type thiamin/hydroxymethylpyrimidine transport system permease subunit